MCSYYHKIRQDCQLHWQIIIHIIVSLKHALENSLPRYKSRNLCKQSQYAVVLMFAFFFVLFVSVSVLFG